MTRTDPEMAADVPEVDLRQRTVTDQDLAGFAATGLLVLRGAVTGPEVRRLQEQTAELVDRARQLPADADFRTANGPDGRPVPFRVEYVVDKLESAKHLLGHPTILSVVERLQGPAFIPTFDSLVFKLEGRGAPIWWHRDAGLEHYEDPVSLLSSGRVFNVDFYLDEAGEQTCLWAIPGSNKWPDEDAAAEAARRNRDGFSTEGAVPLPMQPGDVLLHNVLVVHGSPPTTGALRRVIYYEFRPAELEWEHGPHVPEFVLLKQRVLLDCLRRRREAFPHVTDRFKYSPEPPFDLTSAHHEPPPTHRYPHESYWREIAR